MKDIAKFVNERVRKNKDQKIVGDGGQEVSDEYYASNGKLMKMSKLKSDVTKPAKSNTSRGVAEIKDPEPDKAYDLKKITRDSSKNVKQLLAKFRAKEDFFVQGKAGWAKTSIIESFAAAFNLKLAVVYLDKALATDLGGIPIPTRGKSGTGVPQQEYAMPGWAAEMLEDKDHQYLLFLDEMNQAPTDVQNALMPIILKHEICGVEFDNFFVGAAGNFESENRGVSELSGPLKSRFKPIITWETNTDKTWSEAFDFLHSKWDRVFGPDFINRFYEDRNLFANPRELDQRVFKFIHSILKSGEDNSVFDAEFFNDRLLDLKRDEPELERSELDNMSKLAEYIYDFITNGGAGAKKEEPKRSSKNIEMIPEEAQDAIMRAMRDGFIPIGDKKYGFCEENIGDLFDYGTEDALVNAEQVQRYIKKLKADGIDWYYKSIADIKKDHDVELYKD